MRTDCTPMQLAFEGLGRRSVVGRFDGGRLTMDGGVLLLREVDRRFRVTARLATCFRDHRDPQRIEHRLETLARFAHHRTCRRRLKASAGGVGGFEAVGGVPGGPGPPESGAIEPGAPDSGRGSRWMAGAGQTASVAPVAARAAGGGWTVAGGVSRERRVPAARAGRRARARTAPAAGSRTGTRPGSCGR